MLDSPPILAAVTVIALLAIGAGAILQVRLQTLLRHRGPVRRVAVPLLLLGLLLPTVAQASPAPLPLRWRSSAIVSGEGEISSGRASREGSSFGENRTSGFRLFLQVDPSGYADSPNLYAGFANDPVNRRDPTGRIAFLPVAAVIAVAGLLMVPNDQDAGPGVAVVLGAGLVAAAPSSVPLIVTAETGADVVGATTSGIACASGEHTECLPAMMSAVDAMPGVTTLAGDSAQVPGLVTGAKERGLKNALGVGGPIAEPAAGHGVKGIDGKPEIALGLTYSTDHKADLLERFGRKVGGHPYTEWAKLGLADPVPSFAQRFEQASARTGRIHFNLSGMKGLEGGMRPVRITEMEPGSGEVTAAELTYILQRPELIGKTTFYRDGRVVGPPVLKER